MKVAHVSETFSPRLGGIETALETLFRHTPEIEHLVLTNPHPDAADRERFSSNVRVDRVPPDDALLVAFATILPSRRVRENARPGLVFLGHLMREAERRRRVSRERTVDVVHLHSAAKARYFLNLDRKHDLGLGHAIVDWWLDPDAYRVPVLMTDHSLCGGPRPQFDGTSAGEVVRRVRNLVCVERSGWENATAFAAERGLSTRIWQVPNPVDTDLFPEWPIPDSRRLRVGYVGRADKLGIERVLALAEAAPEWTEFSLALAGSASDLRPGSGGSRVRIEWNIPNVELSAFYGGIHVLLDPWSFGAPRTALEALSTGRVVIRMRSGPAHTEDLPDQISPIVSTDAQDVFAALRALHKDRVELERLGHASRALALSKFDARIVADQYRQIYRQLAAG